MQVRELSHVEVKGTFSTLPAPVDRLLPKYVQVDKTRHGKTVYYFRRDRKSLRVRLRARLGSAEFLTEYSKALAGTAEPVPSLVYFARAGNKVKIGVSKNPRQRLAGIKTGNSSKVSIYYVTTGGAQRERDLHRLFAEYRVNGEWFLFSRAIKDWIAADEAERLVRS